MSLSSVFETRAQALITFGQYAAERQWCPANGGNFSARLDEQHIAISASGAEKGRMSLDDVLMADLEGKVLNSTRKPSDETLLHTLIYSLDPKIGAILHVHSVANTVLSLEMKSPSLNISGYEMLKGIRGISTHETHIEVGIFDNSQDMLTLGEKVKQRWENVKNTYALLVKGHGCYCWGADVKEAKRHLETYEFLFSCEWERLKCR